MGGRGFGRLIKVEILVESIKTRGERAEITFKNGVKIILDAQDLRGITVEWLG